MVRAQGNRGEAKFSGIPFRQKPAFKNGPEVSPVKSRGCRATVHSLIRAHREKRLGGSGPAPGKAARLGRGQPEAAPRSAQRDVPKAPRGTAELLKEPSHAVWWDASPRTSPRISGSLVRGAA